MVAAPVTFARGPLSLSVGESTRLAVGGATVDLSADDLRWLALVAVPAALAASPGAPRVNPQDGQMELAGGD